jgi:hypothetical protein
MLKRTTSNCSASRILETAMCASGIYVSIRHVHHWGRTRLSCMSLKKKNQLGCSCVVGTWWTCCAVLRCSSSACTCTMYVHHDNTILYGVMRLGINTHGYAQNLRMRHTSRYMYAYMDAHTHTATASFIIM